MSPTRRLSAGALALVCAAAGCSSVHTLTRHFSARLTTDFCAAALPTARLAVRDRGELAGVVAFHRRDLEQVFGVQPTATPRPVPTASAGAADVPRACLIVFKGTYAAGSVAGAGSESGRFALVLVRLKNPSVVRVRVVEAFDVSDLTVSG